MGPAGMQGIAVLQHRKRWKRKGSLCAVHTARDPPQEGQGLGPSQAGGGAGSRAGLPQYGQLRTIVATVLLLTHGSDFVAGNTGLPSLRLAGGFP